MQAATIDSNAILTCNMLFYEMDVSWQCVTSSNQITEVSKHLKENKKRKENRYNINLYSIITIIIITVIIIVVIVLLFTYFISKLTFSFKCTILSHLHAFDARINSKTLIFSQICKVRHSPIKFWR